jgi:hypothetical protein
LRLALAFLVQMHIGQPAGQFAFAYEFIFAMPNQVNTCHPTA